MKTYKMKKVNDLKLVLNSCRSTRKEETINGYFKISAVNLLY